MNESNPVVAIDYRSIVWRDVTAVAFGLAELLGYNSIVNIADYVSYFFDPISLMKVNPSCALADIEDRRTELHAHMRRWIARVDKIDNSYLYSIKLFRLPEGVSVTQDTLDDAIMRVLERACKNTRK